MRKNLLFVLLMLLVFTGQALCDTAYRYSDTVSNIRGDVIGGATVNVYVAGTTTKATIYTYASTTGGDRSNPTSTDTYGRFWFYAAPGLYDIAISGTGITAYTVEDIRVWGGAGVEGVYNVIDYGAMGDSTTNDTAAIQAAITAAAAAGKGSVYFPSGDYPVSIPITLASGVSLYGNNHTAHIYMTAGSDTTMFQGASLENVSVSGLYLDGNSANQTYVDDGSWYLSVGGAVIMRVANFCRITDCRIENFQYGVTMSGTGTTFCTISDNHFYNVTAPIDTYGQGYVISDNIIDTCPTGDYSAAAGIQLEVASGYRAFDDGVAADGDTVFSPTWDTLTLENTISGNTIRNVVGHAIVVHGGALGFSITGNSIANATGGIDLYYQYSKNGVISNNTIRNITCASCVASTPWSNQDGIGISLALSLGVTVSDNVIGNASVGILTVQSKRIKIDGNLIERPTLSGIVAYQDTVGSISDNYVFNAQWPDSLWYGNSGIILHSCSETSVKDNDIIERSDGEGRGYAWRGIWSHSGNNGIKLSGNFSSGTYHDYAGEVYFQPSALPTISSEGLVYYDSDDKTLKVYTGAAWQAVVTTGGTPSSASSWPMGLNSSAGTVHTGGFYDLAGSANDFNPSATYGTANSSYAAHFMIVCAAGATDTEITVTGTSMTDGATRTASDTEVLQLTNGDGDTYYETSKKWIGQVSVEKTAGTDRLVNYGFCKYWDNANNDFQLIGFECLWAAAKTDASFDIQIQHHSSAGWTYAAAAAPTHTPVTSLSTVHVTERSTIAGEDGAFKLDSSSSVLPLSIAGGSSEGIIFEIITSTTNVLDQGSIQIWYTQ